MFALTSILLVSFGVLCSATEEDGCKERRPSHCYALPDVPFDFPDNEEGLDMLCPILLPRIECVLDYKKKCPETALDADGFEAKLDDIYAVIVEACDKDSDLNKGLTTHLPCIGKNIQGHVDTCKPMVKEVLEEMTSHLNLDWEAGSWEDLFTDYEARAKFMCTKEALDIACFVASTNVKCGDEAGEISGDIIDRVGILDVMCPEDIQDDIKALVVLVQPLMELAVAAEEIKKK